MKSSSHQFRNNHSFYLRFLSYTISTLTILAVILNCNVTANNSANTDVDGNNSTNPDVSANISATTDVNANNSTKVKKTRATKKSTTKVKKVRVIKKKVKPMVPDTGTNHTAVVSTFTISYFCFKPAES